MRRLFADAEGGAGVAAGAERGAVQRLDAGVVGRLFGPVTMSTCGSAVRDRSRERRNASMRRASGFCV
jgi:hypothetical protein